MGALNIGYAKQAGYEVIITASPHNFNMVKGLGADHVYDRSGSDVIEQVSQHLPIKYWFDTISLRDSVEKVVALAVKQRELESDHIQILLLLPPAMSSLPPFPEGITSQMMLFQIKAPENKDHMEWLLGKDGYMERGLKGGWLRGVPAEIISGLGAVQQGVQDIVAGVSAKKLIIEPWVE